MSTLRAGIQRTALAVMLTIAGVGGIYAQSSWCGRSPSDWCEGSFDDPCSRHHATDACKADRQCYGVPYRGESLVACMDDGQQRGFARNCPTVGCTSVPLARRRQWPEWPW
jgi:hypothetical protein